MGSPLATVDRALDAVDSATRRALDADDLLEQLSDVTRRFIPHDGSAWFGLDPVTMLATSPSRVEHLDPSLCDTFWHLEFHEHDATVYSSLAKGDGAAGLALTLDGRIGTSVRYREFLRPQGYADELRSTFRHGSSTWGVMSLYRDAGRPPFGADDLAIAKAIGEPIADALRSCVRARNPWLGQPSEPGLVMIDGAGRTISVNAEARCWLRDLWPTLPDGDAAPVVRSPLHIDDVPTPLIALVSRARAVAEGRERAPARLRIRDRLGRWVVVHASVVEGPATPDRGTVALVIEAAKSSELAPLVIEAYGLTPRERDVLGAIARGATTSEIAAELYLSPHTVRDHVKTVFEKVGVSSRGELVARLFGDHYSEPLHETMVDEH